MACGTPVVAPNAITFPEIIGDATTLYKPEDHLDLANKIVTLITDRGLYKSVVEHQLSRVRALFNINVITGEYLKLYASLLR
jgi:glycosyltransferase involved in cell wall biosynthesis